MAQKLSLPVGGADPSRKGGAPGWLLVLVIGLCFGAWVAACSPGTGIVSTGPHVPQVEPPPTRVLKLPPPVQVEVLPLRRNHRCEYVDGAWTVQGSSWKWIKGRWVLAPKGCYYAPPQTRYEELGVGSVLVHRPGYWLPTSPGDPACRRPKECPPPEK